mgnify:FL=1
MIFAFGDFSVFKLFIFQIRKKVRSSRITFEKRFAQTKFWGSCRYPLHPYILSASGSTVQKLGTHEYEFSVSLPFFLPNPVMKYFVEPNRRAVSDQNLIFSRQRNRHSNHLSAFSVKNLVPKLSAQVEVNAFSLSSLLNSDKQQTPTRSERLASSN